MKVIAIIQARLGSKRFPNKVLKQIPPHSGISMLELVVRKVLLAKTLDDVIVVTPDRFIAILCNRWKIAAYMPFWKGRDVLREYFLAAHYHLREAKVYSLNEYAIVRLTADCPLIQPEIIDEMVTNYLNDPVDLVYNTDEATGQLDGEGSDVEVFSYKALARAYKEAKGDDREHATSWMRRNLKTRFVSSAVLGVRSVNTTEDYAWVLDYVGQPIFKGNIQ